MIEPKTPQQYVISIIKLDRSKWREAYEKVPEEMKDDVMRGLQVHINVMRYHRRKG